MKILCGCYFRILNRNLLPEYLQCIKREVTWANWVFQLLFP